MTPAAVLTVALVLLAILTVPGYVLLRGLGALRLQAAAGAPAIAALELGALAVVYHWVGLPWSRPQVLAGLAVVWPLGCSSLLAALFPVGRRTVEDGLPVLVGTVTATVATAPFVMMTTLWPYGWSVCLLPGVLSLIVAARPVPERHQRRGSESRWGGILAAALATGVVYVHGTAAFNLAVLGVPVVLVATLHLLRDRWRGHLRSRMAVLAATAGLVAVLLLTAYGFWDQLAMLFSYSRSRAVVSTVFVEALRDDVMIFRFPDPGTGASLLTVMALLVFSVWTGSLFHSLASPWYVQKSRILPLLEIPVLVLAMGSLSVALDWHKTVRQAGGPGSGMRRAAAAVAIVAVAVPVGTAGARALLRERVVAYAYQPEVSVWPVMLAPGEREFLEYSAALLPQGAIILSEPTNGSAYYWSLTGTGVVFPSLRRNSEPDRLYVAEHATDIRSDPEVCAALGRLGAHYLYLDADRSEGGVPAGGESARWRNSLKNVPIRRTAPRGHRRHPLPVAPHGVRVDAVSRSLEAPEDGRLP